MSGIERQRYDAVVIGAGLGGLSAAAALARNGRSVLVAEKNDKAGGNCSTFTRGDYTFDVALHELTGVGPNSLAGGILEQYGIADRITLEEVDPFLVIQMPDASYPLPGGYEPLLSLLIDRFPQQERGLQRLFRRIRQIRHDGLLGQLLLYGNDPTVRPLIANEVSLAKKLTFPFTAPRMMLREANMTAQQFLRQYLDDERPIGVLTASWPYLGSPPHTFAAMLFALWVNCHAQERQFYPKGGSQAFADAFVTSIRERGGTVALGTEVSRVIVDGGAVRGVELADGTRVDAKLVVSNAPPMHLYTNMIEREHVPGRFMRKLQGMTTSCCPFVVLLGLDYDVTEHGLHEHERMVFPSYDHETTWQRLSAGEPAAFSMFSPMKRDRSHAPQGHSTLTLTTVMPAKTTRDWREHGDAIADEMIQMAAGHLPGLTDHIRERELLTGDVLHRFSYATNGSMYGWDNTPEQVVTRRLDLASPINGLYHVGHWSQPGTGMNACVISGWMLGRKLENPLSRWLGVKRPSLGWTRGNA